MTTRHYANWSGFLCCCWLRCRFMSLLIVVSHTGEFIPFHELVRERKRERHVGVCVWYHMANCVDRKFERIRFNIQSSNSTFSLFLFVYVRHQIPFGRWREFHFWGISDHFSQWSLDRNQSIEHTHVLSGSHIVTWRSFSWYTQILFVLGWPLAETNERYCNLWSNFKCKMFRVSAHAIRASDCKIEEENEIRTTKNFDKFEDQRDATPLFFDFNYAE